MTRFGGLYVARRLGESIQFQYPGGKVETLTLLAMVPNGAILSVDGAKYTLQTSECLKMAGIDSSDTAVHLESVEGGRVGVRIVADPSIRIVRSELLRR